MGTTAIVSVRRSKTPPVGFRAMAPTSVSNSISTRHPLDTGHSNRTYPSPEARIHRLDERWPPVNRLQRRGDRPDLGMGRIPLESPLEAVAQIDLRLPADPLADLRGVQVLAVDLPARVARAPVLGLDVTRAELADQ